MAPNFHSLRFCLFILVLVALIPALGMIIIDALEERRQAADDARMTLRRLVLQTSREQLQIINGARQLVMALAQTEPVGQRDSNASNAIVNNILAESKIYHNLGAIAPDGEVFSSALPLKEPVNVKDRPFFQAVLQQKELPAFRMNSHI